MDSAYTREELEQMQHSRVKELGSGFIGNAVVKKYKDDKIFCSKFSEADVEYFRDVFKRTKHITDYNFLWYTLKNSIEEKIRISGDDNSIEPFLYALKLEDNCFGSELSGTVPIPGKLEAYVKAINCIYENENKENFFKVIKHTLVNWEWYQPLHVVIFLCGEYPQFKDAEVDEILKNHMLYRKQYAKTTFRALLNRPSQNNYEEILNFITHWKNKDAVTGTEIEADNSMLTMFFEAMKAEADENLYMHIQDMYIHKFQNRSINRRAKERLDSFFSTVGPGGNWKSVFQAFGKNDEEGKQAVLRKVRMDFHLNKKEDRDFLVDIQDKELFEVVADKISYAGDYDRFWTLVTLGKSRCSKAKEYLRKKYEEVQSGDRDYFPHMLASYLSVGNPNMQKLCDYFFLNEYLPNERIYAPMFKHVISYKKATQDFQNCLERLIIQCKEQDILSQRFLARAKEIFGAGQVNVNTYPVKAMDNFLKVMLEKSLLVDDINTSNNILAILDKITVDTTKSRYEEMLLMFINKVDENTSQFRQARDILRRVNGR